MYTCKWIWMVGVLICSLACNVPEVPENAKEETDHSAHLGNKKGMSATTTYADSVNEGIILTDTMKSSPRRAAMATINGCHIHIDYSSPGVKGRSIWGGLVAYDQVWAAGAHTATQITFNKPIKMQETIIEPGTYAIFMIPGQDEWIAIINKNFDQHLADEYNAEEDVLRMPVVPVDHSMTQRLTYEVVAKEGSEGTIDFRWEKLKVQLPFTVME